MWPEVTLVNGSLPTSGGTKWLARVAAAEDVDGFDCGPVNLGDVSVVRHAWPPVGEHFGRCGVVLAVPHRARAEHLLDGHVEAARAGEE